MTQENDDIYLLTEIASLYYEENYTQEQIAKLMGISRSGVSRFLTRSRELGLVDIHVHHPLKTSAPLRDELMRQFNLQDAQILQSTSSDESLLSLVGALAARYTDRRIQEESLFRRPTRLLGPLANEQSSTSGQARGKEDFRSGFGSRIPNTNEASTSGSAQVFESEAQVVGEEAHTLESKATRTIGISWGTSMFELLKALRPRRRLPLNVVQLMGSVDTSSMPDIDGPEIARRFAVAYGAHCYYLHAPLLISDALVRDGLLKEPSIARSFSMAQQMNMALVGIGGARPNVSGLFRAGYLGEEELQVIRSQGAVGDICGCYFNIDGQLCATELLKRTIAVSFDTLRSVPLVVAVAAGVEKTEAILGALRTGVVKVLITDESCARAVLHQANREFVELSD